MQWVNGLGKGFVGKKMALIEIDGKKIEAEQGSMIIEAADNAGIWIPRFCYHKKLSIAANCRMCLIDVEKAAKPLPACATPITDGMKIWTRSQKALHAQKSVMEFLLINHPLDCPICDQGGECELQDISLGYGADASRYKEGKRSVLDQDLGPLVSTDMTRCIQCTRCVRFGTEVAGLRELGATGRGEALEIGTFIERSMISELSGNVIDICPVGALTSKPYRFSARAWELAQKPSIAAHDCVGSHIFLHLRENEVMRVVPRENESINEVWLSDRDRFSYEALTQGRLEKPQLKVEGHWKTIEWADALEYAAATLLKTNFENGTANLGALVSPNATTEECYLLQKLLRGLGSHNIDHRLRQMDFSDQDILPLFPNAGLQIADLESQAALLLVGSDIRNEQPLLGLKLRKAVAQGCRIALINPSDFLMNFEVADKIIVERGDLCYGLGLVAIALIDITKASPHTEKQHHKSNPSNRWLEKLIPSDSAKSIAKQLLENENTSILLGTLGLHHPEASRLRALCHLISELTGAKLGCLSDGANGAGAWIAGAVPHRLPGGEAISNPGLNAADLCAASLETRILFNLEPELDCVEGSKIIKQIKQSSHKQTVIAFTPFESETLRFVADLLLPICPFSENSGCYVNMEGQWQNFIAAAQPLGEAKPAWKILRVLGNLCQLPGFDYETIEQVLYEIKSFCDVPESLQSWQRGTLETHEESSSNIKNNTNNSHSHGFVRLATVPSFSNDNLLRRAPALQKAEKARQKGLVQINGFEANKLGLKTGDLARVTVADINLVLPVQVNDQLPNQTVLIPILPETALLEAAYTSVEIQSA